MGVLRLAALLEVTFPAKLSIIIALTAHLTAFMAETYRAGMQSVPVEQIEAARMLRMNRIQILRHIIVRQAFRQQIPSILSLNVSMLTLARLRPGYRPPLVANSSTGVRDGEPPQDDTAFLRTRGVSRSFYGRPVLKEADFRIGGGEIAVLIGESGSGKGRAGSCRGRHGAPSARPFHAAVGGRASAGGHRAP